MLRQLRKTAIKTVTTATLVAGTIEITTHLPSEGQSSQFYHNVSDNIVTPFLRTWFTPENAHNIAIYSVQNGFAPKFHPNKYESSSKVDLSSKLQPKSNDNNNNNNNNNNTTIKSLTFPNCIGLAAGFDKDGVAIQNLMNLGFGFVEIGSVTPHPQPGNPKPRMFRLVKDFGVINRFGFNSVGMDVVEENLRLFRHHNVNEDDGDDEGTKKKKEGDMMMDLFKSISSKLSQVAFRNRSEGSEKSLLGVNLGKNKTSTKEVEDYELGIEKLGPYADYLVINISSPNTPGLRDLQQNEPLQRLLLAARDQRNKLQKHPLPPLFVKIAPDLTDDEMKSIASIVMECGIDGILVTNTTNQRPSTLLSNPKIIQETGGLSGAPLRQRSTECIRKIYEYTNGELFIVGIGGVRNGHDVYEKLKAGASVVQMYTGMVYEGPGVVSRIREELSELMVQNGQRCVEDVVGLDHEDIYWDKRLKRTMEARTKEKVIVTD